MQGTCAPGTVSLAHSERHVWQFTALQPFATYFAYMFLAVVSASETTSAQNSIGHTESIATNVDSTTYDSHPSAARSTDGSTWVALQRSAWQTL